MPDRLLLHEAVGLPSAAIPWLVVVLGLAALAMLLRRAGPAWLRGLQLALLLGLAAIAAAPPRVHWQAVDGAPMVANLAPDAPLQAALQAASRSGPRASDLQLHWQRPAALPEPLPWPLGATVQHAGEALPWDPLGLQIECLRPPVVDRPAALRLRLPAGFEPRPGRLRLTQEAHVLLDAELLLQGGVLQDGVLQLGLLQEFLPTAAGPLQVELGFAHGPHRLQYSGQLTVAPAHPVLVWEPGEVLAPALQAQGLAVRRLTHLAEWPRQFDAFAAVVLAAPLPEELVPDLRDAVDAGLGLLVSGPAFGRETSGLRALLPVLPLPPADRREPAAAGSAPPDPRRPPPAAPDANQPPPSPPPATPDPRAAGPIGNEPIEVDKHAIAMVLVVDRSYSMGQLTNEGLTRMDYARASALQTSEALQQGDLVGLVTFGNKGAGRIELPLTDALEREAVRRGVAALAARRELTCLLSGLQRADELLQPSTAAVKHVVVISDGEFDLNESLPLRRQAREMRGRGITVSIISLIAPRSAELFQQYAHEIASLGGGKFLAESDPSQVPVFVSAEVTRALQRVDRQPRRPGDSPAAPAGTDPPPPPPAAAPPSPDLSPPPAEPPAPEPAQLAVHAVLPSPLLEPLPEADWPALAAAEATRAPLDAMVLLAAGDAGWPLLAFAHRGLGRTAAFASDLAGPAASDFRRDPQFPARLARWVDHLARSPGEQQPIVVPLRYTIEPPAPTPRQRQQLTALAGIAAQPAAAGPLPVAGPAVQRQLSHPARELALPALLALLLLALGERWVQRSVLAGRS